ncbi:MAG TPA: methyltransferase domain-containing protein [Ktedonobacteraceae bacterium]|nr:methyltransferase domain-containing protein [Ktedonobacteraceae bacterium]
MSTSPEESPTGQKKGTYIIDAESETEMARLLRQEQLLTQGMGGVFPEKPDLTNVQRVLDLACGPGGWALEVAFTYTDIDVVGIDISERMIAYADAQAEVQQRNNASFQVMNVLKPLEFPDASFDLVNVRLIGAFMHREMWPKLFVECLRILRPGGILRVTEFEWGMTNKAALEQSFYIIQRAMGLIGHNFSPNGLHYGLIHMLPRLFQDAGLQGIDKMAHAIDFSAGTNVRDGYYYDFLSAFQALEPIIVQTKLLTSEEWRELSQKGLAEMFEEDFCSMAILLTVWGRKPE